MNWNIPQTQFAIGDKIVCTCRGKTCPIYFTVLRLLTQTIEVVDEEGNEDYFPIGTEILVSREIYDSPLYKALR